ncbi:MAG: hypothetical protein ACKO72_11910 [Actinomycetes bacterium]
MNALQHVERTAHAVTARACTATLAGATHAAGAWSKSYAIPANFGSKPTPPRRPSVPA